MLLASPIMSTLTWLNQARERYILSITFWSRNAILMSQPAFNRDYIIVYTFEGTPVKIHKMLEQEFNDGKLL
jgi:hypothetical protein